MFKGKGKKSIISFVAAMAIVGFSNAATAQSVKNVIGTEISIGYRGYHLDYKEHCTPSDKDTAWMNGAEIKVKHISQDTTFLGHNYWEAFLFYATSSNGKYKGFSQDGLGHYAPLNTDTTEQVARGEGVVGFAQIGNRVVTKEGILLGEQWWFRKIKDGTDANGYPVKGYEEDYLNVYVGLQFEGDYYFSPKFYTGLVLAGAFSPKIEYINQMYNKYFDVTYKMGTAYYFKAALPIKYNTGRFSFSIEPFFTEWRFHKSDVEIIDGYQTWEPSSTTKETGIYANIGFKF